MAKKPLNPAINKEDMFKKIMPSAAARIAKTAAPPHKSASNVQLDDPLLDGDGVGLEDSLLEELPVSRRVFATPAAPTAPVPPPANLENRVAPVQKQPSRRPLGKRSSPKTPPAPALDISDFTEDIAVEPSAAGYPIPAREPAPPAVSKPTEPPYGYPPQSAEPQYGYPPQPSEPQYGYPPQSAEPQYGYPPQPTEPQYAYPPQPTEPQYAYPPQSAEPQRGYSLQPTEPQYGYPPQPTEPQRGYPPPYPYPKQLPYPYPPQGMEQPYPYPFPYPWMPMPPAAVSGAETPAPAAPKTDISQEQTEQTSGHKLCLDFPEIDTQNSIPALTQDRYGCQNAMELIVLRERKAANARLGDFCSQSCLDAAAKAVLESFPPKYYGENEIPEDVLMNRKLVSEAAARFYQNVLDFLLAEESS